jgi:hypothetical protein
MVRSSLYTFGGTVQAGDGLYIPRQADQELLTLCLEGAFSYVLTPRQMGKSSLMIRTARQLTEQGVRSLIIDLTQLGVQVTAEEWYLGLLTVAEEQLDLTLDVVEWWQAHHHLGIPQRLSMFIQEVLLAEIESPLVIFVDEIDSTLSLNFTDDFFAGIRYLYTTRALEPELRRLSFVLIGVATPGDLIRDPQRTPFNIGQRVDLTDFTFAEALPLAVGLGLPDAEAQQVLRWILQWTGGHPYLTQRLCYAVTTQHQSQWSETDIEHLVSQTFFGAMSQQDHNLQFVRDMLTKRAPDALEVLTLYGEILRQRAVIYDEEQSLIKSHLKLSGVVCRVNSALQVRNNIYRTVFNAAWIKENLPVSYLRKQLRQAIGAIAALIRNHHFYGRADSIFCLPKQAS